MCVQSHVAFWNGSNELFRERELDSFMYTWLGRAQDDLWLVSLAFWLRGISKCFIPTNFIPMHFFGFFWDFWWFFRILRAKSIFHNGLRNVFSEQSPPKSPPPPKSACGERRSKGCVSQVAMSVCIPNDGPHLYIIYSLYFIYTFNIYIMSIPLRKTPFENSWNKYR